ncbi:MAG TPA: hypothetical protein VF294_12415 [Polyangiaceae bacterium]
MTMRRAFELVRAARFSAPLSCAAALAQVSRQSGLQLNKARARSGFGRGHLLDIVVYVPGGKGTPDETDAAEALVRLLVGEELFERWVGRVSATPTVRGGALTVLNTNAEERSALPVETLPETLCAAIAGLKQGLPEAVDAHAANDDWVLFELEPEPAADFAAQDDLVVCSTRVPELKKCFLRGEPFFSGRFANSNVLYAYLKYDSLAGTTEARLAARARFEEAFSRSVRSEQAALVGLGLGVRYGYLDLAVTDFDCIGQQLLPGLRAAGIAQRAWLLFCDSELEREHVPVHSDSPEPYWG